MANIALKDATIADSTANDHITYSVEEYQGQTPEYCIAWNQFGQCINYDSDPIYRPVDKKNICNNKGKSSINSNKRYYSRKSTNSSR